MRKPDLVDRTVRRYERRYLASGNGFYLLLAVDLCVSTGRATPLWAANAFSRGLTPWLLFQSETLDEALNAKRPKLVRNLETAEHFQARRRREQLRSKIILRVWEHHIQKGAPMNEDLFRQLARTLRAGVTQVKEIYYEDESKPLRRVLGLPVAAKERGRKPSPSNGRK